MKQIITYLFKTRLNIFEKKKKLWDLKFAGMFDDFNKIQ